MTEVSVVVPYYEDQDGLERLLAALARQTMPAQRFEVVVADDGSSRPPRIPDGLPFGVQVVRQADLGFRASAARALGARAAAGRVLAFLDGDMIPEPGYLEAACALPLADPEAVVVGRRRHVDPSAVESGWAPGADLPAGAELEEPAWLIDGYAQTKDLRRADATSYRFVISAVLTVARQVYEEAGGFDPSFVGYGGEDWELASRLWRCGARLRHVREAVAWQFGEDFGGREDPVRARRVKNAEAMTLAGKIAAPTARGWALGLNGPRRVGVRMASGSAGADGAGGRPAGAVTAGETTTVDEAAVVLGVDAALQVFPAAQAAVDVSGLGAAARRCLEDPRVVPVTSSQGEAPAEPALEEAPDWDVLVREPLRPAEPGRRPDPAAASELLLRLERAGVETVVLTAGGGPDGAGPVREVGRLTGVRGRRREARGGTARTLTLPVERLGWAPVGQAPDIEGWWGGWA
ncbi:glycosyltransferase [Micrococcus sp. FDAARGOS_333]|uniref:glycosyltransferase n=1 Tax=Micrococcus sp. FDAARGOS_333 TaxID=1930558 RepID=UPI000B4E77D6|nr:glycosyltransferase [Micrococcus sp. FDAARGOS_333]PNL18706.1 glycosyl transferase [Micrococcus sp. FDAARGOS_333]